MKLKEQARTLRKSQTDAESLVWFFLRARRLSGFKFRRQHAFPPYVLDFYCDDLKLAIELDGGQHNEKAAQAVDEKRSVFLKGSGIDVIRYWNTDVLQNLEGVLEDIWNQCALRASPSPARFARHPLPEGEGSNNAVRNSQ